MKTRQAPYHPSNSLHVLTLPLDGVRVVKKQIHDEIFFQEEAFSSPKKPFPSQSFSDLRHYVNDENNSLLYHLRANHEIQTGKHGFKDIENQHL